MAALDFRKNVFNNREHKKKKGFEIMPLSPCNLGKVNSITNL